MKATVKGIPVEGTPEEVAKLSEMLKSVPGTWVVDEVTPKDVANVQEMMRRKPVVSKKPKKRRVSAEAYSAEEDAKILRLWENPANHTANGSLLRTSVEPLAESFGRTTNAVLTRVYNLGLTPKKFLRRKAQQAAPAPKVHVQKPVCFNTTDGRKSIVKPVILEMGTRRKYSDIADLTKAVIAELSRLGITTSKQGNRLTFNSVRSSVHDAVVRVANGEVQGYRLTRDPTGLSFTRRANAPFIGFSAKAPEPEQRTETVETPLINPFMKLNLKVNPEIARSVFAQLCQQEGNRLVYGTSGYVLGIETLPQWVAFLETVLGHSREITDFLRTKPLLHVEGKDLVYGARNSA